MKIDLIAGARPNFVKISPIIDAINSLKNKNISFRLIHTGQHFDHLMSGSFFEELNIPQPDFNLGVGGGTQIYQTTGIMSKYENLLREQTTDLCLVVGDVTSTMACSVTAKKMNIKVAHVEAGIRSYDRTMPEEINRLITDSIADIFFTTTKEASNNLINEGHCKSKIHFVGNTMIDTLFKHQKNFKKPKIFVTKKLKKGKYFILTLHRPANVDNPDILKKYLTKITEAANGTAIIFPAHHRTMKIINDYNINTEKLIIIDPLSYLEFNYLVKYSLGVITDSGGITEEATVMGIPCITLRENTERPETCSIGTNELIGTNPNVIPKYVNDMLNHKWKKGGIPDLWDGNSSKRIIDILKVYKF
jgi:UDP-N-acetylglucosamine 2-epimerase (non-hydrolysing)